jgi:hypothetical protein
MPRLLRFSLCFACLAAMTLLSASVHERQANRRQADRRLHDWDIPQLADYLQRSGVDVRLVPVSKDGPLLQAVYLTSTAKEWRDLNRLMKEPQRIPEWQGTLYCERVGENDPAYLLRQWGDHGQQIGPFLFYGDAELLDRILTALAAPPAAP